LCRLCDAAGHAQAVQYVSHTTNIVDELIVGRRERYDHVDEKSGHWLGREPPSLERTKMPYQRFLASIGAGGDLRGGEWKSG